MKIKNLNLSLFLLFIVVFFSVLGSLEKEAFEDSQKPMPVPECIGGCDKDDSYILKTQIVPPVCPSFPIYNPNEEDNKEKDKDNKEKDKENKEKDGQWYKNMFNNSFKMNNNDKERELPMYNNNFNRNNNEKNRDPDNKNEKSNVSQKNLWDNFKGLGDNIGGLSNSDGTEFKKNNLLNNTDIRSDSLEIENLKRELNKLKQNNYNESCPPCPACERCPEPSFECKKVPNYRSTAVGQYLPLPVLNDFSSF